MRSDVMIEIKGEREKQKKVRGVPTSNHQNVCGIEEVQDKNETSVCFLRRPLLCRFHLAN